MDRYTQLSPEMQELWENKIKLFRENLAKLDNVDSFSHEYDCQWLPSLYDITESLADEYNKQIETPSLDQITTIKSQLKYCKNPLQKLNMEREMNRLIREKERRSNHESRIRRN